MKNIITALGAFDSKGEEQTYLADAIAALGHEALKIDVRIGATPTSQPSVRLAPQRVNAEDSRKTGRILAEKTDSSAGPVAVPLPLKARSVIGSAGQSFHDSTADEALFQAIRDNLKPGIPLIKRDMKTNDPAFSPLAAETLLHLMGQA